MIVRVSPTVPTYVCVDSGAGTPMMFEGILDTPSAFRGGHRLRVNLGKTP